MQKIGVALIMAAMRAKVMVMAARGGVSVGRVSSTTRQSQMININRTLRPFNVNVADQNNFQTGRRTMATGGNCNSQMAFMTPFRSLSSQRIGVGNCANHQQHPFNHQQPHNISTRHRSSTQVNVADVGEFYANPEIHPDFASLGLTSTSLLDRLSSPPLSLKRPSAIQAAVFDKISEGGNDIIVGAETGSGKTLAYLLPLVEDILKRKRAWKAKMEEAKANGDADEEWSEQIMDPGYEYARAIILVPNKELAHQAVRMAAAICGGLDRCVVWGADALGMDFNQISSENIPEEDIVRLAVLPGGLASPQDFPPFRFATINSSSRQRQPPADLVFTTPANLGPMALSPKNIDLFADVSTLVVDEADMLLDGGYIRQLNNALMGFRRADRLVDRYHGMTFRRRPKRDVDSEIESDLDNGPKPDVDSEIESDLDNDEETEVDDGDEVQKKTQHIFVGATLPDYGLRSVDAYLNKKFPNATSIIMAGMHNARHYGLESESQTMWDEVEDNKDRMQRLVDVLRLDRGETGVDGRGLKGEKVMVFLNTVKDVDGATNGLRRAGINAVPYHAKVGLADRTANLDKFRRYQAPTDDEDNSKNDRDAVPVLVCTDVASRGLDIPGVTAIIQLQFALNVVNHLHRMGRCGRAGNRDGRGIIFYGAKERELVEVVREAESQQSRMTLSQDVEDDSDDNVGLGSGRGAGKVENAFSRKRGFTKKRKKQRKRAMEAEEGAYEYD